MIYTTFAKLYDELMDPEMYEQWFLFAKKHLSLDDRILELACGSGRLAVRLAQAGYQVEGFDLSDEMLALAANHADDAQVNLPLYQGDMCDLSGLAKYDKITCFADSFCYLPDQNTLKKAFKQAFDHLNDQGQLLFDVITPFQTDTVYPGYMYNYTDEKQAFVWTSYEGAFEHSVEHELTFFIWNPQLNAYERLEELHHERTYVLKEYMSLLAEAGFKQVKVSAAFGQQEIKADTTRWFFVCQK